ncbi:MAG: glutathione S-transferase family protein [Thermoleophilaceae bacterium]
MIRLYRFPYSTNVERVTLALAHKDVEFESVWVDPADRSEVMRVSGQELVPVVEADGEVLADSTRIVRRLEAWQPDPPLYPAAASPRAEVHVFEDWFNRVWKGPPNAIADERGRSDPDRVAIGAWVADMRDSLDRFEALLDGRDHLMGHDFSAADLCAYPFLKYGLLGLEPGDDDPFHAVLVEYLPLEGHPRVADWIRRVGERA